MVFHHGDMWHGSGFNKTKQDRITLSIHFMNGNSKFHDRIKNPHFNHYKILNVNTIIPPVIKGDQGRVLNII